MATVSTFAFAALALVLSGGCDSVLIVDSDGNIEVAISTRGPDPDPDGYSLTVDGDQAYVLPAAGSLVLQLPQGNHSVQLGGLADNCSVDGANPRAVVVGGGGSVDVSFSVVCVRAATGGFRIVVSTSGPSPDPDGYQLFVAGAANSRFIGTEATEIFERLTPGQHLITLKGLADGCSLTGGNPRLSTVIAGKTIQVRLSVACGLLGDPG
jgi:hypothetical protein